jgi:hypothetical protein
MVTERNVTVARKVRFDAHQELWNFRRTVRL